MTVSSSPPPVIESLLTEAGDLWRYGAGNVLVGAGDLPPGVWLIQKGSIRSLAALPPKGNWRTVERHDVGSLVGWLGLLQERPVEHLRTADLTEALFIPADRFLELWEQEPTLRSWCAAQHPAITVVDVLTRLSHANPGRLRQLEEWRNFSSLNAIAQDESAHGDGDPNPVGGGVWHWPDGSVWTKHSMPPGRERRLIWLPDPQQHDQDNQLQTEVLERSSQELKRAVSQDQLSLPKASGPRDIPIALCQALANHYKVPFLRENVRDEVESLLQQQARLNLINIGQLLSNLDLSVSLVSIPFRQLQRIPTPAVLEYQESLVILEDLEADGRLRLLDPELGPVRVPVLDLLNDESDRLQLLLLRRRPDSKEQRFSWGWYAPFLKPHRRELIEVVATSAVVNVLALVTPLGIMRLINTQTTGDDTLSGVLSIGIILIGATVVEAIATALRSLIFTGIANRVDMDTRETILDRLVRLPQAFFDNRPVGRITYYFNQLDRLRDFLISKALTTILDFSFSILYLAVLLSLNPLLTLITLSTLPLFIVLAIIVNPIVEHQISRTVEEGVRTNSYLTEALTGIQTIKSQNAELKTRWAFQDRYSRFIGEDFKLKVTGETIGALAKFLGELSSIATMVVGVWLITRNELSIGALFAFRIISGKVTGPMIQLVQTWQQFKIQSRNLTLAAMWWIGPPSKATCRPPTFRCRLFGAKFALKVSTSATPIKGHRSSTTCHWMSPRAPSWAWWEAPDPANQLCSSCCRASTAPIAVGSRSMAWTSAKWSCIPCVARSVWSPRTPCYSMARSKTTC